MTATTRRGFTLIEAILVMSLLAVISAIGAPRLSDALRRRTTATAADQFVAAHSLARATAVRYGRTSKLHINGSARSFWVSVDTSGTGIGQYATVWYARNLETTGLTMTSNRSTLCFDARGLAVAGGACQAGDAELIFAMSGAADTATTTVLGKVLR
jgi:prepilin-type N-terminal cleavage/methylation domain-containing protein